MSDVDSQENVDLQCPDAMSMSDDSEPSDVYELTYTSREDLAPRDVVLEDKREVQLRVVIGADKTLYIYSDANRTELIRGQYTLLIARFTDYRGLWFSENLERAYCMVVQLTAWLYVLVSEDIQPFQTYLANEEIERIYYHDQGRRGALRVLACTDTHRIVLPEMWRFPATPHDDVDSDQILETIDTICGTDEEYLVYVSDQDSALCVTYDVPLHFSWDHPAVNRATFPWTESSFLFHTAKGVRETALMRQHRTTSH